MKVYIASNFSLVNRVQEIADILKQKGHEITQEWWHKDYKKLHISNDDLWYREPKVVAISERNFKGIREADRFLLIAPMDTATKFNGANIELGYALALGKPCYSLGKLERSAMYVPAKRCEFIEEVLE